MAVIDVESFLFGIASALIVAALFWARYRPPHSLIKRLWWSAVQRRAQAYTSLFGATIKYDAKRMKIADFLLFWPTVLVFSTASAMLLLRGVGFINPLPQPGPSTQQIEDLKNFDLITSDHEVYMRRKSATPPATRAN